MSSLNWSISRESTFDRCNRKYYLHYYCWSLDWELINGTEVNKYDALFLKKLSSIPRWTWNVMHKILASFFERFKEDKSYTIEKYQEQYMDKLIKAKIIDPFLLSAKRDYSKWYEADRDKALEKKYGLIWLIEHYYKQIPEDENEKYLAIIIDNVKSCILSFSKSQLYQELLKNYDKYEIYNEPVIDDFDRKKFTSPNILNGSIDLYVQPDLYLKVKWENKFIIIDRKTWNTIAEYGLLPNQLLAQWYRLYVENWFDDSMHIEWFFCNLEDNWKLSAWNKVGVESIKAFENEINKWITKLTDNLISHDFLLNTPESIEKFPETKDLKKCDTCAFRFICKQNKHE